jgi:radical SAM protein with 4Fe4S-binding SPASM domain
VDQDDVMAFCQGFLPAHRRAAELGAHLSNSLTFNFDEPNEIACRSLVPMPQLNPDGSVSSCDMALYQDTKEELACFLYGRWDRSRAEISYDQDRIAALQKRDLAGLTACRECAVKAYCAGGCAGRTAFETGDMFTPISAYCTATRFLAAHMDLGSRVMGATHPGNGTRRDRVPSMLPATSGQPSARLSVAATSTSQGSSEVSGALSLAPEDAGSDRAALGAAHLEEAADGEGLQKLE